MAIPNYEAFMAPLLKLGADREEKSIVAAYEAMAVYFHLTEDERSVLHQWSTAGL